MNDNLREGEITMSLDLLKLINDKDNISQRKISEELEMSLGKVNSVIKGLKEKGYIELYSEGNSIRYELSENGLIELEKLLNEQKEKRLNIHKSEKKIVKEAVILGAGYNKEFNKPPGFLKIEEVLVIERLISQLRSNGIKKIIIVTGYEECYYNEFAKRNKDIYCVSNSDYRWTGSMYSLVLAQKYITDDFILIENDMIFEDRVIEKIINIENRDCVVLTTESGSGDEVFVEIRDDYLFKMSKDIHQFNKIDGEMIGISKVSYKLFNLMVREFEGNENPYMNYEYSMLDVARNYKVGYLKFNDLIWGEIDNEEQYRKVRDYIYPIIKRKEIHYKKNRIIEEIKLGLKVDANKIGEIVQVGGMTNKNYRVMVDGIEYILRIPGFGTEEMIDRYTEKINAQLASDFGIDADAVYFDEKRGVKISKMILEAETLNPETAKRKKNMDEVAYLLNKLHNSGMCMENEFDVFSKIQMYENLVNKSNGKMYESYSEIKKEILKLKELLYQYGFELCPCHNDTVAENFIKEKNGKMYLIDWEYSGLNDRMWDVAAYIIENELSSEEEVLFQRIYLGRDANINERVRVMIHKICQDFLWSIWTLVKEIQGDDFGDYGIKRYMRCQKNLAELRSMILEYNQ